MYDKTGLDGTDGKLMINLYQYIFQDAEKAAQQHHSRQ
jgi:hypothetical protein